MAEEQEAVQGQVDYTQIGSPIGEIWIASSACGICAIGLGTDQPQRFFDWLAKALPGRQVVERPLIDVEQQFSEYFSGVRRAFDLTLDASGTSFQHMVWHRVEQIAYGTTVTYGTIAKQIGKPSTARAVGNAVGANPLPILIPCHRVVASDGKLGGYSGGRKVKNALLQIEGVTLSP